MLNVLPLLAAGIFVAAAWLTEVQWCICTRERPGSLWQVEYGTMAGDRLAYVFFAGARRNPKAGLPRMVQVLRDNTVLLHKPGALPVVLKTASPVYQSIDNAWQQFELRVTAEQVRAFLDSKQQEYSVEAFVKFLRKSGVT